MKRALVWTLACLVWGCAGAEEPVDSNGEANAACHPTESLSLQLWLDDEPVNDMVREFAATVVEVSNDAILLEACPDGASGCSEEALRLRIEAPGLAPPTPLGTIVHVDWTYHAGGLGAPTTSSVVLRDLDDDASTAGILLGAAKEFVLDDVPVTVASEELACVFEPPSGGCGSTVAYALEFTATENPSSSVRLGMSETGTLALDPDSARTWRVRNLVSFVTGACDHFGTFEWYLVREN
jgi:hypothetical protein